MKPIPGLLRTIAGSIFSGADIHHFPFGLQQSLLIATRPVYFGTQLPVFESTDGLPRFYGSIVPEEIADGTISMIYHIVGIEAVAGILQHFQKSGPLKIPTAVPIVPIGLNLDPAVEHDKFGEDFVLVFYAGGFITGDIVFCLCGIGGIVTA